MKINVPNNMKSPTVIVIGSPEHQEQKNDWTARRMDILEKKLDQQYKAFIDKPDYPGVIEKLQSSFNSNLNKMMMMNKMMMTKAHKDRVCALRGEFAGKIKKLEEDKDNEREFTSKLSSLENAIKSISLKPQLVRVNNGSNKTLFNSFNAILQKLENAIYASRPRLIPSPS